MVIKLTMSKIWKGLEKGHGSSLQPSMNLTGIVFWLIALIGPSEITSNLSLALKISRKPTLTKAKIQ